MDFVDAVKKCLAEYATFSGRAERSEFWWFFLFQTLMGLGLHFLFPSIVASIVMILLLCPSLAVGARRLHDAGMSGWWQLLLLFGFGIFVLMVMWAFPTKESDNKYAFQ